MIIYGIKLVTYGDQLFNAWVRSTTSDEGGRFETVDKELAEEVANKWRLRNPKGNYVVEEVSNDESV